MKKIFNNNRIIAIAFLTVFTVALAPAAMAIEKKPVVPAELVFVGNIKNRVIICMKNNWRKWGSKMFC